MAVLWRSIGKNFRLLSIRALAIAQYIQRREYISAIQAGVPRIDPLFALDDGARQLITRADTLFVAGFAPPGEVVAAAGVNVSHRGGRSGFVGIVWFR
jgi:hypothetical protein